MEDNKSLKEVTTHTDITKSDDNPLLKVIKEYFKKEKEIEFVNYDSSGDVVTIDLRFKFNEDNISAPNDPTLRTDARQQAYDVKRKLEEFLFKEFNISVLSIQGLSIKTNTVEFEISFIYKNTGNFKAEYNESNSFKNSKGELIKEGSICYYNNIEIKVGKVKGTTVEFFVEGNRKSSSTSFLGNKLVLKEGSVNL